MEVAIKFIVEGKQLVIVYVLHVMKMKGWSEQQAETNIIKPRKRLEVTALLHFSRGRSRVGHY